MKIDTNTLELIDRNSWERRNISLAGPLFGYSSSKVTIPGEGPTIVRGTNEWDYNTVQTGATLTSFPPYNSTDWVEGVDFLIEYGTGSYADATAKAQTQCDAADSPDGWFTDANTVPGGYAAVSKVRVRMLRPITEGQAIEAFVNLKVKPGGAPGDYISVAASYDGNWSGFDDIGTNSWDYKGGGPIEGYDPLAHLATTKEFGDRAEYTSLQLKLVKSVSPSPQVLVEVGDTVSYTLDSFVEGAPGDTANNVSVIDVLPGGLEYVGGTGTTPEPDSIIPDGGGPGTTLLIWDLGNLAGNSVDKFTFETRVTEAAGQYASLMNIAQIDGELPGGVTQPDETKRSIVFSNTGGTFDQLNINKQVMTPFIGVGAEGEYSLAYSNPGPTTRGDVRMVDVLPYQSDGRVPVTDFNGTSTLSSVTGTNGETFQFTNAPSSSINPDPDAALPGGALWCDQVDFGTVGCPSGPSFEGVTAIKVVAPDFPAKDPVRNISVKIDTDSNIAGDVYTNNFSARSDNLLPVYSNDVNIRVPLTKMSVAKDVYDPATGKFVSGQGVSIPKYKEGTKVKYKITVKNEGNVPLTDVIVSDKIAPVCNKTIATIAAGESFSYECEVAYEKIGSVENIIDVTATSSVNSVTATGSNDADVEVVKSLGEVKGSILERLPTTGALTVIPISFFSLMLIFIGYILIKRRREKSIV